YWRKVNPCASWRPAIIAKVVFSKKVATLTQRNCAPHLTRLARSSQVSILGDTTFDTAAMTSSEPAKNFRSSSSMAQPPKLRTFMMRAIRSGRPTTHCTDSGSGIELVYPQEPSGGAWIACNGQGNLLALLNWSGSESHNLGEKRRTRGLAIPELIGLTDLSATDSHFHQMNLDGLFPFRLVGV